MGGGDSGQSEAVGRGGEKRRAEKMSGERGHEMIGESLIWDAPTSETDGMFLPTSVRLCVCVYNLLDVSCGE